MNTLAPSDRFEDGLRSRRGFNDPPQGDNLFARYQTRW
jgi:hypothetical protein